jgi:hypothetical protein
VNNVVFFNELAAASAQDEEWQEEFDRLAQNPRLIETVEIAAEVLTLLDNKLESIGCQLDAATTEAQVQPLSPDRQEWLRRVSWARAKTARQRNAVAGRHSELSGKPVGGSAEHERVKAEAEEKRAARALEHERLKTAQLEAAAEKARHNRAREESRTQAFVDVARRLLPPGVYMDFWREVDAQGIEAEGGDAQRLRAQHESPVPEGDAPP